jgi:(2R)-ethylmalonyl-CoA mutase
VLDAVKASGDVDAKTFGEVVGRISFFVNAGLRFITELCKLRALAEMWDDITANRYGVADPKQRLFRYGVQVNSLGLTEQQPENNVYRILIEMLAVTLAKDTRARAVQLPAWNEALGLPRPWDQQWSLRMQQILAYETCWSTATSSPDRPRSPGKWPRSSTRRARNSTPFSAWAVPSPRSRTAT